MVRATRPFSRPVRQALQRRMGVLAMENASHRGNAAVRRVLELLSEEHLTEAAAKAPGTDSITMECGVLEKVWNDPRISNRVNQLSRQGVVVEREVIETRYGETGMVRDRLVVKF